MRTSEPPAPPYTLLALMEPLLPMEDLLEREYERVKEAMVDAAFLL